MIYISTLSEFTSVPRHLKINGRVILPNIHFVKVVPHFILQLIRAIQCPEKNIIFWGCPQNIIILFLLKSFSFLERIVIVEPFCFRDGTEIKTRLNYSPNYLRVLNRKIITVKEFQSKFGVETVNRINVYVDILILRNTNNLKRYGCLDDFQKFLDELKSRYVGHKIIVKDHPFYLQATSELKDFSRRYFNFPPKAQSIHRLLRHYNRIIEGKFKFVCLGRFKTSWSIAIATPVSSASSKSSACQF